MHRNHYLRETPSPGSDSVRQQFEQARGGSDSSLGELFDECRNYLLLVARQQLDSRMRVKSAPSDLVQETFIEARRQFAAFNGNDLPQWTAWLRQILLFKVSESVRRYRKTSKRDLDREVPLANDNSRLDVEHLLVAPESRAPGKHIRTDGDAIAAALARLPEHYQQVIRLRQWEALSFDEIAAKTNRTTGATQRMWARAVRRLREEVERDERK